MCQLEQRRACPDICSKSRLVIWLSTTAPTWLAQGAKFDSGTKQQQQQCYSGCFHEHVFMSLSGLDKLSSCISGPHPISGKSELNKNVDLFLSACFQAETPILLLTSDLK